MYFGSMSICLNIPNFAFVYIDFMIFQKKKKKKKKDFGMLTSDSLLNERVSLHYKIIKNP